MKVDCLAENLDYLPAASMVLHWGIQSAEKLALYLAAPKVELLDGKPVVGMVIESVEN
jgi:hypothetical protein